MYIHIQKIGETHLLHYDELREICGKDEESRIPLVFASGCHSQEVAKTFAMAGINHVVGINTNFEKPDNASNEFTKHLRYT